MNPALQELYQQLQKREIGAAEFGSGISDLCSISPALSTQASELLTNAMKAGLISPEVTSQLLQSLRVDQQSASHDATVMMASKPSSSIEPAKSTVQRPAVVEIASNPNSSPKVEATQRIASSPPPLIDIGVLPVRPGSIIKDRFLLKEQIGSGGMGVVFSAVDQRKVEALDPNPMVAVKILGTDFAQHPQALIALQREARKAQELAHPNVVTVFDFDRDGDMVYMTMELLQGRSLDSFIREVRGKGADRETAMFIIRGIAEGLAYAHRKGIVHSDLKPANIFLCKPDNSPKLLDFGIARAVPGRDPTRYAKDVFDAGALGAYTLPYATEEMIAGVEPHPADDLYALGLIACELLSGEHPFKRQGAVEARKQGMKPTPIKGLSREEWKTIESCLSFDRANRPKDAGAFLRSLNKAPRSRGVYAASIVLLTAVVSFAYSGLRRPDPVATPVSHSSSSMTASEERTSERISEQAASMARDNPVVGNVEHVAVTSHGQGSTLQAAVDQALQLAVEQINGKTIDASSTQFQGGMAVAFGKDTVQLSSAAFANYVTVHSKGVVTDFQIVEQKPVDDGFAVTIHANIAKFVRPEGADRLRVVMAPLRLNTKSFVIDNKQISSQEVSGRIHKNILDALVQTNRVAALDREFSPELNSEVELIESGNTATEDQARSGQQLPSDYVLVGTIDKFEYIRHERQLRMSYRTLVYYSGGAALSLRLVNAATRQVEFAATMSVTLPETAPTTLNTGIDSAKQDNAIIDDLIRQLSEQSVSKVMSRLFPVTVLTVDGDDVVLSQGEGQVHEGSTYNVNLRGKEMKDPQTGQSLGRLEKHCCAVLVTRVAPTLSYGKVVAKDMDVAKAFAPGALELVDVISQSSALQQAVADKTSDTPKANGKVTTARAVKRVATQSNSSASSKTDSNW